MGNHLPATTYFKGTAMTTRAIATFTILGWEETVYDEPAEGAKLSRATVRKTFEGDLVGESATELLMSQASDMSGRGYVALERITGRLGERSGSFDVQHCASQGGPAPRAIWFVVPGSGTGELRGLYGDALLQHDENGATFILDYDFDESQR